MGLFRTLFLGDIGNHLDIQDNKREIARMRRRARQSQRGVDKRQDDRIQELESEIDQLHLLVASVVRSLVSRQILTVAELDKLVSSIEDEEEEPAGGSS